ncbi:MAG TPA: phosphohistidine phosphatase SixA [Methylococcales bacterium]
MVKKQQTRLLYVVRHADAVAGYDDAIRPLSKKGQKQAADVGAFLKKIGVQVDAVWHSGLVRARQTAEIIADRMKTKQTPEAVDEFGPDDNPIKMRKKIEAFNGDLMVVGHAPSFPELIPVLLGLSDRHLIVDLKKAGVVCLETDEAGKWLIKWCIDSDLL